MTTTQRERQERELLLAELDRVLRRLEVLGKRLDSRNGDWPIVNEIRNGAGHILHARVMCEFAKGHKR